MEAAQQLTGFSEKAEEAAGEMDEFFKSAAQGIQSSLADFLFDPFAEGVDDMLYNFTRMIQRMLAEAVAAQIAKALFGGMGKGGSDDWGFVGSAIKMFATSSFAVGGIMSSGGPVPIERYATGGVATSPQMAYFGEGSTPEAFVPVPSGKIPVELSGGGAAPAPQSIRIVNAFDTAVVGEYMGSADGEKIIMNAVRRNASAYRQVLSR